MGGPVMNRRRQRLALPAALAGVMAAQAAQDPGATIIQSLDAKRQVYADIAKQIWGFAEVGYQEQKSSALLQSQLRAAGFDIKAGVAGIPTAFVATAGSGKPVIGIVGEFDALPGLSQDATATRLPLVAGGPGHGCGHNLFGTGSVAAAIAVKEWIASSGHTGTLHFFGTPAEEGGAGKYYMLRAGLFTDVDTVVAWHPGDRNEASPSTTLANISAKFRFHGLSAHAAAAPDKGRSALDAVEAMDHMVNLMREHVPQETRIHYVITNGGGAPNVVPDFAEVYYYARQPDMKVLDGIWERIVNAAKGAALGTGTTMDMELIGAVYNVLPNEYLSGVMRRSLTRVGGVTYTPAERQFAETIRRTLTEPSASGIGSQETVRDARETGALSSASTDLGDVSWNVPTVQLTAATFVPGVPAHSWQATACAGGSIGAKGMMVAAKTMALTTVDLFSDATHVQRAREEFDRRRGAGFTYSSRLGDRQPPIDYRK
jgi:aminobenzoyl-glutamate utilization protein B